MTQLDTSSHHPISDDQRFMSELIGVKMQLAEVMHNMDIGELHTNRYVRSLEEKIRLMQF